MKRKFAIASLFVAAVVCGPGPTVARVKLAALPQRQRVEKRP